MSSRKKKYYEDNKDFVDSKNREWVINNREKSNGYKKKWASSNKDICSESSRRWAVKNKGKVNSYTAFRRSLKKKATPSWIDKEEVRYIYSLASKRGLVVDHIVPLNSEYVCGLHVQDNLRCIPDTLNAYKGSRYW